MLNRLIIHFSLIFLFAFTQIGVAAHEISHLNNAGQHSQPESPVKSKNSAAEQCAQCLSFAKAASGLATDPFRLTCIQPVSVAITLDACDIQSRYLRAFSARAPPQSQNS